MTGDELIMVVYRSLVLFFEEPSPFSSSLFPVHFLLIAPDLDLFEFDVCAKVFFFLFNETSGSPSWFLSTETTGFSVLRTCFQDYKDFHIIWEVLAFNGNVMNFYHFTENVRHGQSQV